MSQDDNQNDRDPQDGQDQGPSQGQRVAESRSSGYSKPDADTSNPPTQVRPAAPELDDTDEMDDDDDRDDDDRGPGSPNRRHNIG